MLTIEQAKIENFPYKEGDPVKVSWAYPKGLVEHGVIDKLHTSVQWGHKVVYAIMVKIQGEEKPCVVSYDCIVKVN